MPAPLMTKADFIRRTKVVTRLRSAELQKIDRLLGEYEMNAQLGFGVDTSALKLALIAWQKKESKGGKSWTNSDRNKQGAIAELEDQLTGGALPVGVLNVDAAHSRLGVIHLFAHARADWNVWKFLAKGGLELTAGVFEVDQVSDAVGAARAARIGSLAGVAKEIVPEMIPDDQRTSQPPRGASEKLKAFWNQLKEYFIDFGRKIFNGIVDAMNQQMMNFQAAGGGGRMAQVYHVVNQLWQPIEKLINTVVGKVAADAAPFVSGAINLATGLKTLFEGIYARYRAYASGKGVRFNEGHPVVIVDAIKKAMNINIGKGIYETLKGGASLGMAIASFGASAIVDLVVAGAELIIGFIHRKVEIAQINAFGTDCKERWVTRGEPTSIQNRAAIFGAWFRGAALTTPAIAALTLTCGCAGDKMQYLQMFSAGDKVIDQATFNRGVQHVDELKQWSRDYLAETGYRFVSDDQSTSNIIEASTDTNFKPITVIENWRPANLHKSKGPVGLPSSVTMGQRGRA